MRDAAPRKRAARWATAATCELRVRRPERGRVTLGHHRRALIAAEQRASVMVVGPTQSGKTTGLVVPAMREWDGPVLATSSRPTSSTTRSPRAPSRARCGSLTPRRPPRWARGVVAAQRVDDLDRRAPHRRALLGVGEHSSRASADDAFWRPAAARYLAALLFAADARPPT